MTASNIRLNTVLIWQVSSPVELEQCDEETLAALLCTDHKVCTDPLSCHL